MSRTSIARLVTGGSALMILTGGIASCSTPAAVPPPRTLVLYSGERLMPTQERLNEIDAWIRPQLENIEADPSFLVRTQARDSVVYPWEELEITADTVDVAMETGSREARIPYMIYAHLHLMEERDELAEWLPSAVGLTGYELERSFLQRTSDAWLYGRSAWDAPPYQTLDELIYSAENGYLDAFILTARPDEFADAREEWLAENPDGPDSYRAWFEATFGREPPGLRDGDGREGTAGGDR